MDPAPLKPEARLAAGGSRSSEKFRFLSGKRRQAEDVAKNSLFRMFLGMAAIPMAGIAVTTAYLTPRYMPSASLQVMPAPTPDKVAKMLGACRSGARPSEDRLRARPLTVWSWENDTGFVARTTISCVGETCSVAANAVLPRFRYGKVFGCSAKRNILIYP